MFRRIDHWLVRPFPVPGFVLVVAFQLFALSAAAGMLWLSIAGATPWAAVATVSPLVGLLVVIGCASRYSMIGISMALGTGCAMAIGGDRFVRDFSGLVDLGMFGGLAVYIVGLVRAAIGRASRVS